MKWMADIERRHPRGLLAKDDRDPRIGLKALLLQPFRTHKPGEVEKVIQNRLEFGRRKNSGQIVRHILL